MVTNTPLPEGIEFRKVNSESDLDYAYDLFKRLTKSFVEELAGEWPEEHQKKFFPTIFLISGTRMVFHDDKPVGCFSIVEKPDEIKLQSVYIEPAFQGSVIARRMLQLALDKAHEARKPLQLDVLSSNHRAYRLYQLIGFKTFSESKDGWVREYQTRHKDTFCYAKKFNPSHAFPA